MHVIEINVGLDRSHVGLSELAIEKAIVRSRAGKWKLLDLRVAGGVWNGVSERTLVAKYEVTNLDSFLRALGRHATACNQQAIAAYEDAENRGWLVGKNPNGWTFDLSLFNVF